MESSPTNVHVVSGDFEGAVLIAIFKVMCFKRWVKKYCGTTYLLVLWGTFLFQNDSKIHSDQKDYLETVSRF